MILHRFLDLDCVLAAAQPDFLLVMPPFALKKQFHSLRRRREH